MTFCASLKRITHLDAVRLAKFIGRFLQTIALRFALHAIPNNQCSERVAPPPAFPTSHGQEEACFFGKLRERGARVCREVHLPLIDQSGCPRKNCQKQKAYLLRQSEEIDRQAKPAKRREVPDVPEKALLALGGKKVRRVFFDRRRQALRQAADIIFGPEGETQLVFSPSKGRVKGAARWKVDLKGTTSRHDLQRELSKANRGLWDKEKGEPSVAFKAVEQLLHCYIEIERKFRRTLLLLLLRRLREEAKQDGEAAEDTLFTYPKPQVETLREELATVRERLETVSEQLLRAQDAIVLVVEALSKDAQSREEDGVSRPNGKLPLAFDLWRDDQWPDDVTNLQNHA